MSAAHGQSHWATMAEVGSAKGILILFWIYKLLGRFPFQIALAPVAAYFFIFKPRQRSASREFLSARYAERLEERCRSAPFQWFNFFPFWSQHEVTRTS